MNISEQALQMAMKVSNAKNEDQQMFFIIQELERITQLARAEMQERCVNEIMRLRQVYGAGVDASAFASACKDLKVT